MIIADTGFWLALINSKDKYHFRAKQVLVTLKEPLITTCAVMTEASYLLLKRFGTHAQMKFIEIYEKGAFEVFQLTKNHALRIKELMRKYADLPMDLADASLVVLAEHLRHGRILSSDKRDFDTYRWKQHKPFSNMLLPKDI